MKRNLRRDLTIQIARVKELIALPFDNPRYITWRLETGQILSAIFGQVESEAHPCVLAFLSYEVPTQFTADREDMQEYYSNILSSQCDLLTMYLEDMENSVDEQQMNPGSAI